MYTVHVKSVEQYSPPPSPLLPGEASTFLKFNYLKQLDMFKTRATACAVWEKPECVYSIYSMLQLIFIFSHFLFLTTS